MSVSFSSGAWRAGLLIYMLLADGTFNSVLARNKPVKHRHVVVTRPDAKPGRDREQRTLPSYGNPMPAR
jgi:hypothetical protein